MDGSSDIGILLFNVGNDLAVGAVETDLFTGVADLAAHLTSNCFEVNLGFVEARHFSKKDNLQKNKFVRIERERLNFNAESSKSLTMPVLVAVSIAHLASGLALRQASRIPSEI